MLTEKFFFTKNFFLCYTSCGLITTIGNEHQSQKKNSVNLEEEKFKSWNKSGRQLKMLPKISRLKKFVKVDQLSSLQLDINYVSGQNN